MERISYKTITIILLSTLALLSVIHTVIAKQEFYDAAVRSQSDSLSRVVEIASDDTLKQLHEQTLSLANTFRSNLVGSRPQGLTRANKIVAELDALFSRTNAGASRVRLAKLRVYDDELNLVAQNSDGLQNLPSTPPHFIREQIALHKEAEPLKAVDGLWQSSQRPLYSLLLPLGRSRHHGYLEVVADPLFNLRAVARMTKLPIRITSFDGRTLFSSPSLRLLASGKERELQPVDYPVHDTNKKLLYHITTYQNTHVFESDLKGTLVNSAATFIFMTLAILLLIFYLLNRLLFEPVNHLIERVQECVSGNLDSPIEDNGVKEVHLIAHTFNAMAINLRRHMSELQRLSSLDGLTGIANRRIFDQLIEQEWTRALRNHTPLAMLIIDLDNFKAYNDSLGHPAGDQCLREVAQLLQGEMKRPGDTVARYGGEEFAIILPDTDIFGAGVVALNIRNMLQSRAIPHPASDIAQVVTLSIGINVATPDSMDSIQSFISGADRALYLVKRNGRNNICFADDAAKEPRSCILADSRRLSH